MELNNKNKLWAIQDNCLYLADTTNTQKLLENVIYTVEQNPKTGELYLKKGLEKTFNFDFKIYALEKDFITRVLSTYNTTTGNLGVLMNGLKGTGKTITSELIANGLNLPIILVNKAYQNLNSFIIDIPQDVCILIDEFEKIYTSSGYNDMSQEDDTKFKTDSSLLSLMDGTYKNEFRKVFLLTTNKMWLNENMLNRPSRIRYIKQFGDLNHDQIMEILDDILINKEFTESVISFLKPLEIITVDIVKAVINEVNMYNEPADIACKYLNVQQKKDAYHLYEIDDKGDNIKVLTAEIYSYAQVKSFRLGHQIYIPSLDEYIRIKNIDKKTDIITFNYTAYNEKDEEIVKEILGKFVKEDKVHQSFVF